MGLLSRGGYDKRQEQDTSAEAQASSPLCDNCPQASVARDIKIALASENEIEWKTGQLAKNVLELAGCQGPMKSETIVAPGKDLESMPSAETLCMNPYIQTAREILNLTSHMQSIAE